MRTIAIYQLETTEPSHIYIRKIAKAGGNANFRYIDIDDTLAEFIINLYNIPQSKYNWDKIIL